MEGDSMVDLCEFSFLVLSVDSTLYCANLGDSKAVYGRVEQSKGTPKILAISLSKDHNPDDYEERMRIQKAGGKLIDGRVMGILEGDSIPRFATPIRRAPSGLRITLSLISAAQLQCQLSPWFCLCHYYHTVARSIGDGRFKHLGVSPHPDVIRCPLGPEARFLLLACDGLWKVFSVQEAVEFVHEGLDAGKVRVG